MSATPLDPIGKRILLVNDDGINAPGLRILEKIARELSNDIWIFAPETEKSGSSHSLTLNATVRIERVSKRKYSVVGTPTDCVLMAINTIMKDSPPDLVLSGINQGLNIADDISYSGTVAAAMEGAMLGIPSISLSQQSENGGRTNWSVAKRFAPDIIARLLSLKWRRDVFMNINFPVQNGEKVSEVIAVRQGQRSKSYQIIEVTDPRKNNLYMIGNPHPGQSVGHGDTDNKAVERGAISVTPLHANQTHAETLRELKTLFNKD